MNILHTVEFYPPSVGGAQEVVKQISEHLVARGHHVTIATSRLPSRSTMSPQGVHIEEFDITGNAVRGFHGEIDRYQRFLIRGRFDVMLNYAAQQWSADLAFPILDLLPYKKVLVPCGFSALYAREYTQYFEEMPEVLSKYDSLVFHASKYRDIEFARQHGLTNFALIPNGASEAEFELVDPTFRRRYGIPGDSRILLTVGSHTGLKGHKLVMRAYRHLNTPNTTLIVIGNAPPRQMLPRRISRSLPPSAAKTFQSVSTSNGQEHTVASPVSRSFRQVSVYHMRRMLRMLFHRGDISCTAQCTNHARCINLFHGRQKRVLLLDPLRQDVVAAYHASDLFVFGSNLEYSPLVLFEAMASCTPFLTLSCGNAEEIIEWSNGGGLLIPTVQRGQSLVDGDALTLANIIDRLLAEPARLKAMGQAGHAAWKGNFTWDKIAAKYEDLYYNLTR